MDPNGNTQRHVKEVGVDNALTIACCLNGIQVLKFLNRISWIVILRGREKKEFQDTWIGDYTVYTEFQKELLNSFL